MPIDEKITEAFVAARASLSRVAVSIVPPKEVEDIVQETYVRVCQVQNTGRIRSPKSFMLRTVRNLALDFVKRSESRLSDSYDEQPGAQPGEFGALRDATLEQVSSDQRFSAFAEAVRCLPVQCRRAFVLKKVYGCSQKEIAQELQISQSTVEKHISTGIKRCALFMRQRESGGLRASEVSGNEHPMQETSNE